MLAGNYTLLGLEGFEVRGTVVGIVGTGAIGSLVYRILLVSPYSQQLLVSDTKISIWTHCPFEDVQPRV